MPKKSLAHFLIEDLARVGKVDAARRELRRASRRKIERGETGSLALLAWRLRLPELGIKLLRHQKRITRGGRGTATRYRFGA